MIHSDSLGFSIFFWVWPYAISWKALLWLYLYMQSLTLNGWFYVLLLYLVVVLNKWVHSLDIWYLVKKTGSNVNELQMDFFLSITTGFLFFIGLLMFQAAIGFSDTHYHHQGEGNKKMKLNHSSGAIYLKWCCTNVLLSLASQAFK